MEQILLNRKMKTLTDYYGDLLVMRKKMEWNLTVKKCELFFYLTWNI